MKSWTNDRDILGFDALSKVSPKGSVSPSVWKSVLSSPSSCQAQAGAAWRGGLGADGPLCHSPRASPAMPLSLLAVRAGREMP